MEIKRRLDWIDICKFLSITLVICLHFGVPHFIDSFVHLFHMPIFFFLSGLCLRPEKFQSFSEFSSNRARRLLQPYFIVAILFYLFWTLIHYLFLPERVVSLPLFLRSLLWTNTTAIQYLWGGVQWFLTSLFFCEMIFFILYKFSVKPIIVTVICTGISLVTIFVSSSINIRLPLALDTAFVALAFYCFGFYFRKISVENFHITKDIFCFFLSLILTIIFFFFTRTTNLRTMNFGRIWILYLPGGLFGSLSIVFAGNILDKIITNVSFRNCLLLLGRNTLFLLYSHRLYDGIDKTILYLAGISFASINKYVYYTLMVVIFLIISIPILNIWEKHKNK